MLGLHIKNKNMHSTTKIVISNTFSTFETSHFGIDLLAMVWRIKNLTKKYPTMKPTIQMIKNEIRFAIIFEIKSETSAVI